MCSLWLYQNHSSEIQTVLCCWDVSVSIISASLWTGAVLACSRCALNIPDQFKETGPATPECSHHHIQWTLRSKVKTRCSWVGLHLHLWCSLSLSLQTHISRLPPGAVAGQSVAIEGGVCRLESPVNWLWAEYEVSKRHFKTWALGYLIEVGCFILLVL